MSKQNFDKFINQPIKGAKKKEQLKQEKKAAKKEREAYFIEKKRQMRAEKKLQQERQSELSQSQKPNNKDGKPAQPPKRGAKTEAPAKTYPQQVNSRTQPAFAKKELSRPAAKNKPAGNATAAPFPAATTADAGQPAKKYGHKGAASRNPIAGEPANASKPPAAKVSAHSDDSKKKAAFAGKSKTEAAAASESRKKSYQKDFDNKPKTNDPGLPYQRKPLKKAAEPAAKPAIKLKKAATEDEGLMPLNKFVAHGGICSRRDAGELVKQGKVKVNGEVMTNPAYKVQETDTVTVAGKKVTNKVNLVYILLNKPKDYITTAEDPQGRKTVLDIVKTATTERIYPVGRLDRNTSGVLLLTNDGELAQQLTHPSFEVRKIYEAKLDRPLAKADFEKLLTGIGLEDGEVRADSVAYADSKDKSVIGVEIHSGKNRVVRRMFEHLGYDVKGLDRVMFANLTKKNVDRGKWRYLSDKEIRLLKFFNKSKR